MFIKFKSLQINFHKLFVKNYISLCILQLKRVLNANYTIYDASAGSGKTYTLTREYLKIILSGSSFKNYQNILALTFTNKAVNEMKERILNSLSDFSLTMDESKASSMFLELCKALDISASDLQKRAKRLHKDILHNYAFFDVSTIDKFTHRLIRTFAKDLKLPQNFEVVLDTNLLLEEAVANLIQKAGTDEKLTQFLIDFALEKIDADKSWDMTTDLIKVGKLLFNENNTEPLKKIRNKSSVDFLDLKKIILSDIKNTEATLKATSTKILETIANNGLDFGNFKSSYFPKFILSLNGGNYNQNFNAGWKQNFDSNPLYTKTCSDDIKAILDGLHPEFIEQFNTIKNSIYQRQMYKNIYTNIVPLTVLNEIQKEIKTLEEEKDILPISSFNTIISNEIKDQPAPFIYERIGEKYRHYFIDEFQDTSEMQWGNLIPLIANALESEDLTGKKGSLLLVGDAKQAIYRWRGGKSEQFTGLTNATANPFYVSSTVQELPQNYRSHQEIINFNNDFFTHISSYLNNQIHQDLFLKGNQQKPNLKTEGYVNLQFLTSDEDENEQYCANTLTIIKELKEKEYNLGDICILTRKKAHGNTIASYLQQHNIPIISSESLLLSNNDKVNFLVNLIQFSIQPENLETSYSILFFLSEKANNTHLFIQEHLRDLSNYLLKTYDFNIDFFKKSSLYDGLELVLKKFNLTPKSDAYITFFMDVVYEVELKNGLSTFFFLDYWEKKKESLSITAPENVSAVRVMTIHKSKGLEFPVVIFPFANEPIYKEIEPKLWLPVNPDEFNGFDELLISKKQEVLNYGAKAEEIYHKEHHNLELDAYNLLYVALTRAEKALFILSKNSIDKNDNYKTNSYSGLFISYLKHLQQWQDNEPNYVFGSLEKNTTPKKVSPLQIINHNYTYKDRSAFTIVAQSGKLWDTTTEDAINKGNLYHTVFGWIKTKNDIETAFTKLNIQNNLSTEEIETLKSKVTQVITHPKLAPYYKEGNIIKNEKGIITESGLILRPDRIIIQNNDVTIIDYKTGKKDAAYHRQIIGYASVLETMGYTITNKILIYINDNITLEFI